MYKKVWAALEYTDCCHEDKNPLNGADFSFYNKLLEVQIAG